jgi:hypothetical protein
MAAASNDLRSTFEAFAKSRDERAHEIQQMKAAAGEMVREVDRILGTRPGAVSPASQELILTNFLNLSPLNLVSSRPIYILTHESIKAALRDGIRIPYFSYDPTKDLALFSMGFGGSFSGAGLAASSIFPIGTPASDSPCLAFPVPDAASASTTLTNFFSGFLADLRGAALHEVVEHDIVMQIRFADPFYRWFSDGFATAVAESVLDRMVSPAAAKTLADYVDPRKCATASNSVSLRWWMPNDRLIDPPIQLEADLQRARYAYSAELARTVIRQSGIDSVKPIMQLLARKTNVTSSDIESAIQTVTKVNVKSLLDRRQSFASVEEGINLYSNRLDQASAAGEGDQVLFNCFRLVELQIALEHSFNPALYVYTARLLNGWGHSRAAIDLFRNQIAMADTDGRSTYKSVLQQEFIKFAWQTDSIPAVFFLADDILRTNPNDAGALSVRMYAQWRGGHPLRSKEIADKILADPKADEFFRERATTFRAR